MQAKEIRNECKENLCNRQETSQINYMLRTDETLWLVWFQMKILSLTWFQNQSLVMDKIPEFRFSETHLIRRVFIFNLPFLDLESFTITVWYLSVLWFPVIKEDMHVVPQSKGNSSINRANIHVHPLDLSEPSFSFILNRIINSKWEVQNRSIVG